MRRDRSRGSLVAPLPMKRTSAPPLRRSFALVATLLACVCSPALASAAPGVYAERGGPYVRAIPTYPEDSLAGLRAASSLGGVQLDVQLSRDKVPILVHDATVDRVTYCVGRVASSNAAALIDACGLDALGSPGNPLGYFGAPSRILMVKLGTALSALRDRGGSIVVRVPDSDTDGVVATQVLTVLKASGLSRSRLYVQSKALAALRVVAELGGGVRTVYETSSRSTPGLTTARSLAAAIISPPAGVSRTYVRSAHRRNLRVVPHDVSGAAALTAAQRAQVDGVLTLDPTAAHRAFAAGD